MGRCHPLTLAMIVMAALTLLIAAQPAMGAEWTIQDDVIGHPPGPGFDQAGNLYYYSNLHFEMRIRNGAGGLTHQITTTQPPFSTTGFDAFFLDFTDFAVAPDGTAYFLISDDIGSNATTIKLVGLASDHQTLLLWSVTYDNLSTVYPSQIATDSSGNLYIFENTYYIHEGTPIPFVQSVTVKKLSTAGQTLWTRTVDFPATFSNHISSSGFTPLLYVDTAGTTLHIVNEGRFWVDAEKTITSPTNLMLTGIDGATGTVLYNKRIGDLVDPSTGTAHELTALVGNYAGRPYNGAVSPTGQLLMTGVDTLLQNGSFADSGAYWLFIDRTGTIQWQRKINESLPAALTGIDPDFANPASIVAPSFAFDNTGMLYIAGPLNASVVAGDNTLTDTSAFVAKYDLLSGRQWAAPIGGGVASESGFSEITTAVVATDRSDNVYISQGIYADTSFIWHRFIEKNPAGTPALTVLGTDTNNLGPLEVVTGPTASADSLKDKVVLEFVINNNTDADVTITEVSFTSTGRGVESQAIESVRLLDAGSNNLLTTPEIGATTHTFTVSQTLAASSSTLWQLVYDMAPNACTYIDTSHFTAHLTDLKAEDPAGVAVKTTIGNPDGRKLVIPVGTFNKDLTTDNNAERENTALLPPLRTLVEGQSTALACGVAVVYDLTTDPANGTTRAPIKVLMNGGDKAESTVTFGKPGIYTVDAYLVNPVLNEHPVSGGTGQTQYIPLKSVPPEIKVPVGSPKVTFAATAMGVTLSAQHDGDSSETLVRTFVRNIPAANLFTATVVPGDKTQSVEFDLNGQKKTGTGSNGTYTATYDMNDLQAGVDNPITATATLTDGGTLEKTLTLRVIEFPAWIPPLNAITNDFVTEFKDQSEEYHVGFSYPVDFIWDDTIAGSILLLGGKKNDANLNFKADAYYHINRTSRLTASGALDGTVLGWDYSAKGAMVGQFNETFQLTWGEGNLQTTIPFTLPDKGVSKTVYVYAVPVTIALDVGGEGKMVLAGSATLGSDLEFKTILIHPAVDVTLDATASVAAFYGAAKLSVNAKPLTELEMKLRYASVSGVDPTFGGRITIPVTVLGSIFWGTAGGTLATTTLGPYGFGTLGASASALRGTLAVTSGLVVPEFFANGDIAASGQQVMVVVTGDANASAGAVSPELYFLTYDGAAWSAPALVAAEPALWESTPALVHLDNGYALALWTANDGDPALANLNDIFAHQDIRSALWDGTAWRAPVWVTDDGQTDGMPDVSYDAGAGAAMAVWFHDANTGADQETRTEWDIHTAVYDAASQTWSTPVRLSGDDDAADYMPRIAAGGGRHMAVWARDNDGSFVTVLPAAVNGTNVSYANADGSVYYAIHQEGHWQAPAMIPGSRIGFIDSPAVVLTADGSKALAAWTSKANGTEPGTAVTSLNYAIYTFQAGAWGPVATLAGGGAMEGIQVVIDAADGATVLWRAIGPGGGSLMQAAIDLSTGNAGAKTPITVHSGVDLGLAAAVDANGAIHGLWQQYDFTGTTAGDPTRNHQLNLAAAAIGGVPGETLLDPDNNSLVDTLDIAVSITSAVAGQFRLDGILADSAGQLVASLTTGDVSLGVGTHTVTLTVSGKDIAKHNVDGPYTLSNLVLLDMGNGGVVADTWQTGWQTAAHTVDQFTPAFAVVLAGDVDGNLEITLTDAIAVQQVLAGLAPYQNHAIPTYHWQSGVDINGNQKIGVTELIFILQRLAGLR